MNLGCYFDLGIYLLDSGENKKEKNKKKRGPSGTAAIVSLVPSPFFSPGVTNGTKDKMHL